MIVFQTGDLRIRRNIKAMDIFVNVRLQTHSGSEMNASREKFSIWAGPANSMCFPNPFGTLRTETI